MSLRHYKTRCATIHGVVNTFNPVAQVRARTTPNDPVWSAPSPATRSNKAVVKCTKQRDAAWCDVAVIGDPTLLFTRVLRAHASLLKLR